jgi:ribonuclease-3
VSDGDSSRRDVSGRHDERDKRTELDELEEAIGFRFADRTLLERALVHRSARGEDRLDDNETLEFLGDAVLDLAISELLMQRHPDLDEGRLSRRRAALVSAAPLAELAAGLGLGDWLRLGKGEESNGGRVKKRILAGAYEALIGAVFLDGGYESGRKVVAAHFGERLMRDDEPLDYKTELQELTQRRWRSVPSYRISEVTGPDHERLFDVEVEVDGRVVASGRAGTRKRAEQHAARQALAALGED